MQGDIKNTFQVFQYPELDITKDVNLKSTEILKHIEDHEKTFLKKYEENEKYFIGVNSITNSKKEVDEYEPDNRISVPYAKTLTQTVKGYMYKAGLITYDSEDEEHLKQFNIILEINKERLKTSELGEAQSKYGVAFELLYSKVVEDNIFIEEDIFTEEEKKDLKYDKENNLVQINLLENQTTKPFFCQIKPQEIIPIYIRLLEKELYCAIRYYIIEKMDTKKTYKVEIYYNDRVFIYDMVEENGKKEIKEIENKPHFFHDVPLVVYRNNEEFQADYEPVKTLIDAYDKLLSSATNEEDRFASAYLVLKNYILSSSGDANEQKLKMERLKKFRIFEVQDNGEIQFLTKEIPSEFIDFLKQAIREDIQFHSHIPDFRDKNFQSASGESMKWALFDFENFCADKEAYFELGLEYRIKLIRNFLNMKSINSNKSHKISIRFERNLPTNDTIQIDNVIKIKQTQLLADEDLIPLLPADMVPDPDQALENMKKQKEENLAMFDLGNIKDKGSSVEEKTIEGKKEKQEEKK